ncbi:MAG: outer membrane protein transport protein [Bacteroidetes bacterium]|nr:outer membrane protein transport protein [Bacteroidota bacterium]MBU1718777.1 outer membrane protein transport protein [Bacteroidota bacterium]
MKTIYTFLFVALCGFVSAQNEIDALRYSFLMNGGTARHMSLGGATGALGADPSVLSTNPAGIGVFKKSEFMFTPAIVKNSASSSYLGSTYDDTKYNFNFSNMGIIGTYIIDESAVNGWSSLNFGFAVNRSSSFHNRIDIYGHNSGESLIDEYVACANGNNYSTGLDPFSTELAFNTWLIDTMVGSESMYLATPRTAGKTQRKSIMMKGAVTEPVITFGGNYGNRFYMGGSFGFPTIRYVEESTYTETFDEDTLANLKSLTLNDQLRTFGNGFNFKFGMIFSPVMWVRLGAAVHTPSFFAMNDKYSKRLVSTFDDGVFTEKNSFDSESPKGVFDYELTTPMKAIGSIAFIIGEHGFISGEYEFVDYGEPRLRSSSYEFFDENDAIQQKYRAVGNYRIGAEWRMKPYAIRFGYAFYDSPYDNGINDGSRTSYSAGFGFRNSDYYIDFAYILTMSKEDYYLYSGVKEAAVNEFQQHNIMVTLGFRY